MADAYAEFLKAQRQISVRIWELGEAARDFRADKDSMAKLARKARPILSALDDLLANAADLCGAEPVWDLNYMDARAFCDALAVLAHQPLAAE